MVAASTRGIVKATTKPARQPNGSQAPGGILDEGQRVEDAQLAAAEVVEPSGWIQHLTPPVAAEADREGVDREVSAPEVLADRRGRDLGQGPRPPVPLSAGGG